MENCAATSNAELEAMKTKCWSPNCGNRAFIRDWGGWQWCFTHWWRTIQDKDNWRIKLNCVWLTRVFLK